MVYDRSSNTKLSSGSKKKNKRNKRNKNNNRKKYNGGIEKKTAKNTGAALMAEASVSKHDLLALVPGIMLCCMTVIMLLSDLTTDDFQLQYDLYPKLFRYADASVAVCGIAYFCVLLANHTRRKLLVRRIKTERTWLYLALFLICIFISTCINGFTSEAIHGIPYRNIGVFNMVSFVLLYMGVSSCIRTETMRKVVVISIAAAADAIAVSAVYDLYVGEILSYRAKKELSTIFFNGNHYGYFLVIAVLIGFGLMLYADRALLAVGVITSALNMIALMVNHSLGCILAVVIVIMITSAAVLIGDIGRRKRLLIILGAAIVFFILAWLLSENIRDEFSVLYKDAGSILAGDAKGSEGHNRIKIWRRTWGYITEKPIFGYGCEGISDRLYIGTGISNPHNELLTYAAYYGIPAAILYLLGVVSVFANYLRKNTAEAGQKIACMAAAGYFISSMTGVAMFYLTPLFFVLLGISVIEKL